MTNAQVYCCWIVPNIEWLVNCRLLSWEELKKCVPAIIFAKVKSSDVLIKGPLVTAFKPSLWQILPLFSLSPFSLQQSVCTLCVFRFYYKSEGWKTTFGLQGFKEMIRLGGNSQHRTHHTGRCHSLHRWHWGTKKKTSYLWCCCSPHRTISLDTFKGLMDEA